MRKHIQASVPPVSAVGGGRGGMEGAGGVPSVNSLPQIDRKKKLYKTLSKRKVLPIIDS